MSKTKLVIIFILLLALGSGWVVAWWRGREAQLTAEELKAAKAELTGLYLLELEQRKPDIPDLPDHSEAAGVMQGSIEPEVRVVVRDAPACPVCPEAEPQWVTDPHDARTLQLCLEDRRAWMDAVDDCRAALPGGAWLLFADLVPEALGARCRAEWVRAPGGSIHGRLFGSASLALTQADGRDFTLVRDWEPVEQLEIGQVAPSEATRQRRWAAWLGVHLYQETSSEALMQPVAKSQDWPELVTRTVEDTELSWELGAAWWPHRRDRQGHRRLGVYASIQPQGPGDSLSGSLGLALTPR